MIVDVLRNDLGRVCQPGTVRVPRLCRLERTAAVQHLVSTVTGVLAPDRDAFDLLAAAFPGGSITGAPKIRAMEILEGLEPVRRGPYTGAIGWIGPDGAMQTSIVDPDVRRGRPAADSPRRWRHHLEERPGRRVGRDRHEGARAVERDRRGRGRVTMAARERRDGPTDRPRLGRRTSAPGRFGPHLRVRPRLPARRRHLRDAPRARRPRHGAGGTRRAPASIRCGSRYPARRRPRPAAADRASRRCSPLRDSTGRTGTPRSGSRSRAGRSAVAGLLPPDEDGRADGRRSRRGRSCRARPTTSLAAFTSSRRPCAATRPVRWPPSRRRPVPTTCMPGSRRAGQAPTTPSS